MTASRVSRSRAVLRPAGVLLLGSLLLAVGGGGGSAPSPAAADVPGAVPVFDGSRAFELVKKQCGFGPRNPGSEGHRLCLDWMERELKAAGAQVRRQPFQYTPPGGKPLAMNNLVAAFQPENPRRLLLCAHWDTRPWADKDPDPARRNEPVLGANDGASGVAVLLELARHIGRDRPGWGVDLVLFDGEDLGSAGDREGWFRGSREYGRTRLGKTPPQYAILLDMVGDSDLMFYIEGNSLQGAPETLAWVWGAAREVAPAYFADQVGYVVEDDHLPLLAAGIPCIDLIDFHYPHWHTTADTPDKVSAASLQVVGDLLVHLLYRK